MEEKHRSQFLLKSEINIGKRFEWYWKYASVGKRFAIYWTVYTSAFILAFLLAYSAFLMKGTSFVWIADGRTQHYPFFVYLGRMIRQVIRDMAARKTELPLFDLSLGFGDDIIGLMNVHGDTNPLMLVSALVPVKYSEYIYAFMTIFRAYLAGLSFSCLCVHFRKRASHALIGSILYAFSGYAILCTMRHPYFMDAMYLLPILIIGADLILEKKRAYIFIFGICYSALCGYYHLYMMSVLIIIFSLVRFFDIYVEHRLREFVRALGRGIAAYCLGIGLAAVPFFPSIMEFLNAARAEQSVFAAYNYSWQFFLVRIMRFIAPSGATGWGYPTVAALALLALAVLAVSKQKRTLKILTATAFIIYFTDIGNYVMNGFQYPSERWSFGLVLIVAYITVEMLPVLFEAGIREKVSCWIVLLFFVAGTFFTLKGRTLTYSAVGTAWLLLTMVILMAIWLYGRREKRSDLGGYLKESCCLLLVIANVGVNGIYWSSSDQGNYIKDFTKFGTEMERLASVPERAVEPYLKDASGRTDSSILSRNTAGVWHIPTLIFYSSVENRNVSEFFSKLEDCGQIKPFCLLNTDQRSILNTLASVRYHIEPESRTNYIPFGYTAIGKSKNGNVIYHNDHALPWGYTYDYATTYAYLENLNGIQREELMLQAVALEEEEYMDFQRSVRKDETDQKGIAGGQGEIQFDDEMIPFTAECKDCSWENGILSVKKNNATITLNFSMPADRTGYLRFSGLDPSNSGRSYVNLKVTDGRVSKSATSYADTNGPLYSGQVNFTINLGYCEEERQSLKITIPTNGEYKLGKIELFAQNIDNYPARAEALREEPLENIEMTSNHISGTVDLSKDKILCLSVPYSEGWSAVVDGAKTEILRGNYMFMCIPLTAGHHEIEFSYCSPGLKLGIFVSLISLCIVAGMVMRDRLLQNGT